MQILHLPKQRAQGRLASMCFHRKGEISTYFQRQNVRRKSWSRLAVCFHCRMVALVALMPRLTNSVARYERLTNDVKCIGAARTAAGNQHWKKLIPPTTKCPVLDGKRKCAARAQNNANDPKRSVGFDFHQGGIGGIDEEAHDIGLWHVVPAPLKILGEVSSDIHPFTNFC